MIATPTKPDKLTKRWLRDESDERAARDGCKFKPEEGERVVKWIADTLCLYEGECAGRPFILMPWAEEAVMRLFGWQKYSDRWGRWIRRFNKASWWVPKKNGKSPLLAAIALYCFAGDGEQGQKCFLCAKDGTQAREIAGRHAIEMCMHSEALMSICSINRSKMQITDEETRSILLPLSSDDERSQKAKEGLNGSLFIDECHVVDGTFMSRVSRAGISRSEPIQLEVSTAGNEPESYGRAQYDYGKSVADGRKVDQSFMFLCYEVPQELPDSDLLADPVKFGKLANPAWGHTVGEEEYLDDFNRSKTTLARLAEFKQYRLNIWQASANPWLSVHDWAQCPAEELPLPESADTFGGLDLSRTTDLTAWVLYQPDAECPRCYGHYWCPEERLQALQEQLELPFLEWVEDGWITISGTKRIDFGDVSRRINEDAQRFSQLRYVGFDPYQADPVIQGCRDDLGLEMVECRQGVATLSAPSKMLERLVLGHNLDHRNDPVLAWMVGNTSIRLDENGNVKPVKTVGGVRKHIDGVVALIMAIHAAMLHGDDMASMYDAAGSLAL